jgi:hypothetical protein
MMFMVFHANHRLVPWLLAVFGVALAAGAALLLVA